MSFEDMKVVWVVVRVVSLNRHLDLFGRPGWTADITIQHLFVSHMKTYAWYQQLKGRSNKESQSTLYALTSGVVSGPRARFTSPNLWELR
jgi:hypothetical protein